MALLLPVSCQASACAEKNTCLSTTHFYGSLGSTGVVIGGITCVLLGSLTWVGGGITAVTGGTSLINAGGQHFVGKSK
jgi:hypothetical protein